MGKGGGGVSTPPPNVVSPPRSIPGEDLIQALGTWRTQAAAPWASSPYRPMDFLFGLPAPMLQVPQFQPMAGTSTFSSGRPDPGLMRGGYSQGFPQGSPMALGVNPWMTGMLPGMFPPALSYAGGPFAGPNYRPGTQYPGMFQPPPQPQTQPQQQQQQQAPPQRGDA